MTLKAGDTVILKSGNGPVMVIGQIGNAAGPEMAVCFYGSDGVSHNYIGISEVQIPIAALRCVADPVADPD